MPSANCSNLQTVTEDQVKWNYEGILTKNKSQKINKTEEGESITTYMTNLLEEPFSVVSSSNKRTVRTTL